LALLVSVAVIAAGCSNDSTSRPPGSVVGSVPGAVDGAAPLGDGQYRATIRRTPDGVPHIVAADWSSASFGQGYASAEDRSCDLADQIVKIKGERAKWLGPGEKNAHVDTDFAWRAIGIYDRATKEFPTKSSEQREAMSAFAAGWNKYLAVTTVDGIEGWCKGEPWVQPVTGADIYAYARSISLQASSGALATFIAQAIPPGAAQPEAAQPGAAQPGTPSGTTPGTAAPSGTTPRPASFAPEASPGSNGWAFGKDRTASGGGMLVANPHFPWEQELRFWEVHITVPGQQDIYGAQLSGLPGVGIGFTDSFAWTHTVSAGRRFTAYSLDLVPGSPTSYKYDEGQREMTSREVAIEVKQSDGSTTTTTRTAWSSHYGPIISFPGVGWTEARTITFRDANIDNTSFVDQYLAMDQARSLDELIAAHEKHQGVPLFNTIATGKDGRAWYADTSATPNLSPAALSAYEDSLKTNVMAAAAADNGAVLLDGSKSLFEWVDEPGARSPGLVPYARMPKAERSDYLFNANDSFWVSHAEHLLSGDYSPLHGRQGTARSLRTRENATVLRDTSAVGPSGADGKFDLDELAKAALLNRGYSSRALLAAVSERCRGVSSVDVPALANDRPELALPAETIDITQACSTLQAWDGTYDLSARGAGLWREFMGRFESKAIGTAGVLWQEPFDAAKPVDTPSGLAPAPTGGTDPVLVNLARAVQIFGRAGKAVDAPLGELQFADRNGERVPIHGGNANDGTTNVVGYSSAPGSSTESIPKRKPPVAAGTGLTPDGYQINNGTSFMMVVEFAGGGVRAKVLLSYGNTQHRSNPVFVDSTKEFSSKAWRDVVLGVDAAKNTAGMQEITVTGSR